MDILNNWNAGHPWRLVREHRVYRFPEPPHAVITLHFTRSSCILIFLCFCETAKAHTDTHKKVISFSVKIGSNDIRAIFPQKKRKQEKQTEIIVDGENKVGVD